VGARNGAGWLSQIGCVLGLTPGPGVNDPAPRALPIDLIQYLKFCVAPMLYTYIVIRATRAPPKPKTKKLRAETI